jgi:hypothetical protein
VAYVWLAAAVAVALWLDQARRRRVSWALFAVAMATLAPNLTGVPWATRVDEPPLLTSPAVDHVVRPGSTVLAVPYGIDGNSMSWQVEAGFRFRLAGGYISWASPAGYRNLSILHELTGHRPRARATERLCAFIRRTGTTVVLARDHTRGEWRAPVRTASGAAGRCWWFPRV